MESKYSKKYIIDTGTGLQDVDNLKNSAYFKKESERYIKGEISLDELDDIISEYYESKPPVEDRSEEADKIAIRIGKLISEDSFSFTVGQYLSIHSFLFKGVIRNAGMLRKYNFTKEEWILDGASVIYGDYRELEATLQYDFSVEKHFDYSGISIDEVIDHLAIFVANLWQIHAFEEGNTRTTAVFFIKYLRSLGFDVTNDTFSNNAWYFRNALARANYNNISKGIVADRSYLLLFLRNLLLGEKNKLQNRDLHIGSSEERRDISREMRILELMKKEPGIKLDELSSELGVSLRTAKSLVAALKAAGRIRRINGKRYGEWQVGDRTFKSCSARKRKVKDLPKSVRERAHKVLWTLGMRGPERSGDRTFKSCSARKRKVKDLPKSVRERI